MGGGGERVVQPHRAAESKGRSHEYSSEKNFVLCSTMLKLWIEIEENSINNWGILSRNFCDHSSRTAEALVTPLMTGDYQDKYILA